MKNQTRGESPLSETACSRLADCLESPPPYRKHVIKQRLWLVLDAHGDSVLWSDQELAVDAAVEALNAVYKIATHIAKLRPSEVKTEEDEAWENALGGVSDILSANAKTEGPAA